MKKITILLVNLLALYIGSYSQSKDTIPQLISACKNNDINKVKSLLLSQSKDLNIIYNEFTPLFYAIQNENFEMVKLLVNKGANVNLSSNSVSPMYLADAGNYTKKQSQNSKLILDYLLKCSLKKVPMAPNSEEIRKAISTYTMKKYKPFCAIRIFQVFPDSTYYGSIRVHCDVAVYDETAMIEISKFTENAMEEPLPSFYSHIKLGDPNGNTFQLIINSKLEWKADEINRISNSALKELNSIIELKSNPNTKLSNNVYPLIAASTKGDKDMLIKLIDMGADINVMSDGFSAIHMAAYRGFLTIVEILVSKGADIDKKSSNGANCLHLAATAGHANVVEYLIKHGSPVDFQNQIGSTPLNAACCRGHVKIVNILLNNNADPNYSPPDGKTALIYASMWGWDKIVQILLSKKVNINAVSKKYGLTALHFACMQGHTNVVKVLLIGGANKGIKDIDGMTPLDLAKENKHFNIVELLNNPNTNK